jgi:hypothetical protein
MKSRLCLFSSYSVILKSYWSSDTVVAWDCQDNHWYRHCSTLQEMRSKTGIMRQSSWQKGINRGTPYISLNICLTWVQTLTFQGLAVTLRITRFNFNQFSMVVTLRLCVWYLCGNNLQLLPYTSSNDWFFKLRWRVFTARYALSLYIRMRFVFKGLISNIGKRWDERWFSRLRDANFSIPKEVVTAKYSSSCFCWRMGASSVWMFSIRLQYDGLRKRRPVTCMVRHFIIREADNCTAGSCCSCQCCLMLR